MGGSRSVETMESNELRLPPDVEQALYYGVNTKLTASQRHNLSRQIANGKLEISVDELIKLVRSKRRFEPKTKG